MDRLKAIFKEKAQAKGQEIRNLLKNHGDKEVDQVKISQMYGGMRGIKSMVYETSALDPVEGIRFRGFSIPELRDQLPACESDNGTEPLPEGLFWLMLTGEIPLKEDAKWLKSQWAGRMNLPEHTKKFIESMPLDTHPMTLFSMGIMSMQTESIFAKKYAEGMKKDMYWDATYEDAMNLIANLPALAAYIYRHKYHGGKHIAPDPEKDWAGNFAHMLGGEKHDFRELMRLYLTIHADHEGGNASAHTVHLVNSTLSDVYYSLSAGINALAGPLHGLANQEVIKWVFEMIDELGTDKPNDHQIEQYIQKTLEDGRVIPGYGHAVLRRPDPRFVAQKRFAERNIKESNLIDIIWKLYEFVPPILMGLGKVKNPWPNVDAHSGALLVHYGMKNFEFYTVLFGVGRALGVLAASIWSRALGLPLERPKSVTSEWVKEFIKESQI